MYINKVSICGVDTSKLPVLKEAEKTELLKRVKEGSASARQELINGNLRLVLSVIQKFTSRGENLDDLFQVGCIGLINSSLLLLSNCVYIIMNIKSISMNMLMLGELMKWFA